MKPSVTAVECGGTRHRNQRMNSQKADSCASFCFFACLFLCESFRLETVVGVHESLCLYGLWCLYECELYPEAINVVKKKFIWVSIT